MDSKYPSFTPKHGLSQATAAIAFLLVYQDCQASRSLTTFMATSSGHGALKPSSPADMHSKLFLEATHLYGSFLSLSGS